MVPVDVVAEIDEGSVGIEVAFPYQTLRGGSEARKRYAFSALREGKPSECDSDGLLPVQAVFEVLDVQSGECRLIWLEYPGGCCRPLIPQAFGEEQPCGEAEHKGEKQYRD